MFPLFVPSLLANRCSMSSYELIALVTITYLFGGFVKGAVGLGLPVVGLAFLAPTLGLKASMAILLVPGCISNVWQALSGPAFGEICRRLRSFLLAAVAGIWFGVMVLAATKSDILLGLLGIVLCVYSVISLMRPQISPPGKREPYLSPMAGAAGGIMFGMTGTFIVPGLLYLQALGLKRDMMVQAMGITFVAITWALAASFAGQGLITTKLAALSAFALLPTAVGIYLGQKYRQSISEDQFRKLFFAVLFVVGIYMFGRVIFEGSPV